MAYEGMRPPRSTGRLEDPIPLRRAKNKLFVLEDWLENGVPPAKAGTVPSSLAQAFAWEDTDLGLRSAGSRRDFVTTHPVYGGTVAKIGVAIAKLKRMAGEPKVVPLFPNAVTAGKAAEKRPPELVAAVSQWHAERQRAESLQAQLVNANHQRGLAEDDVARLETEVRGLRLRLAAEEPIRLLYGARDETNGSDERASQDGRGSEREGGLGDEGSNGRN